MKTGDSERHAVPLSGEMAGPTRFELATSGVTGRRSNQLNYDPASKTDWNVSGRSIRLRRGYGGQPLLSSAPHSPGVQRLVCQPQLAVESSERRLVGGTGLEPVTAGV